MGRRLSAKTLFFVCLTALIHDFSDCCDHDEMASGCRLERSSQTGSASGMECLCGVGCDREFQFRTLAECEAKLKSGQALTDDPCSSSPCQNGGVCIQVRYGRFRCECTGTGFYGDNCAKECPQPVGPNAYGIDNSDFPLECITI